MKKRHFAALFVASFVPGLALAAPMTAVEKTVAADFPNYDADKSGELNNAEFDTWMLAVKKTSGAALPDAEWLAEAFAKADADQNKTVSAGELTTFLSA